MEQFFVDFWNFTGALIKKIIIQADMYYKLYKNICGDVKLWVVGNHQIHKNKIFMHPGKFKFPLIKKSKDHTSRHVL